MSSKPYDQAILEKGTLVFEAAVPAFDAIGGRFAKIVEWSNHHYYPPEYLQAWRKFVAALRLAVEEARAGRLEWTQAETELERRFAAKYSLMARATPPVLARTKDTPEGLGNLQEWLVERAESALAARESYAADGPLPSPMSKERRDTTILYRFECGEREKITESQKRLFEWFIANQEPLAEQLKSILRELYQEKADDVGLDGPFNIFDDPSEELTFPTDDEPDAGLDRFQIKEFILSARSRKIGITFETLLDGHYLEHGCALLIDEGEVVGDGTWDSLDALYDEEQNGDSQAGGDALGPDDEPTTSGQLPEPLGNRDVCTQLLQMIDLFREFNNLLDTVVDEATCEAAIPRAWELLTRLASAGRCYAEAKRRKDFGGDYLPLARDYLNTVNAFYTNQQRLFTMPKMKTLMKPFGKYGNYIWKPSVDYLRANLPSHLR